MVNHTFVSSHETFNPLTAMVKKCCLINSLNVTSCFCAKMLQIYIILEAPFLKQLGGLRIEFEITMVFVLLSVGIKWRKTHVDISIIF